MKSAYETLFASTACFAVISMLLMMVDANFWLTTAAILTTVVCLALALLLWLIDGVG